MTAIRKNYIAKEQVIDNIRSALDELHNIGFAHCDLKLSNCFYDRDARCAFLDDLEYLTLLEESPPDVRVSFPLPDTARELDELQFVEFVKEIRRSS